MADFRGQDYDQEEDQNENGDGKSYFVLRRAS